MTEEINWPPILADMAATGKEVAFGDWVISVRAATSSPPALDVSPFVGAALDYFLPFIERSIAGQEAQDRIDERLRASHALHAEFRTIAAASPPALACDCSAEQFHGRHHTDCSSLRQAASPPALSDDTLDVATVLRAILREAEVEGSWQFVRARCHEALARLTEQEKA